MTPVHPLGQLLTAPVTNGSASALFGTHIDYLGVGGYRTVADIAARNAIPTKSNLEYDGYGSGQRRVLMLVSVASENNIYILLIDNFASLSDSQRLAALKDNANWVLFTDFLNIKNSGSSSTFIQDEFPEFTATSDGIQNIPLPTGANAVIDITVLESTGGVRKIYQKDYSVNNSVLIISADANILTGDKICGTYYIKNGNPVTPTETITIIDAQGDDAIVISFAQAS